MQYVYIAVFGACGCLARYAVSGWTYRLCGTALPWGTLAVNVVGSFCVGLIMETSMRSSLLLPELRIGLTVGFLGGFTTFSTFSYETMRLLEEGSLLQASGNILLSVLACVLCAGLGIFVARQL